MMNTQQSSTLLGSLDADGVRALPAGHVVALGTGGGRVSILSGRVWLTSGGDPGDHVLGAGESFDVGDSGPTLVETWSRGGPALIAWRPRKLLERVRDRFTQTCERCWDLVSPTRRGGIGTVAAVAAIAVAGALFGPVSESRVRALAAPVGTGSALLHNPDRGAAGATGGALGDGSDTGHRTPGVARQADRRAPGAA